MIVTDRRTLDLSQPRSIASVLDRLAPELIINTAAYTAVDQAEDEKELAEIVNAEAPGIMARWAAERRVPLIHFSTDYVFDGSGDRPWREEDQPRPLSAYGASKLAGEEAIRRAGGDSLIVRTSWVYAAKGKNFLRTIARLARERPELRVVDDQIGAPTSTALSRRCDQADAQGRHGVVPCFDREVRRCGSPCFCRRDELARLCRSDRARVARAGRPACG